MKGAFSTGHLHSQCGSSLTGEGLPLRLEQKSHFSPTLQEVGMEMRAVREDTRSGVYTIPTQKCLAHRWDPFLEFPLLTHKGLNN